jgi:hypothetical protein
MIYRFWSAILGGSMMVPWTASAAEKPPITAPIQQVGQWSHSPNGVMRSSHQHTMGSCGSCGSCGSEPYRPCLQRIIDFLCYRPLTSRYTRLEPTDDFPPPWAFFPAGVCHSNQGSSDSQGLCRRAGGCAQCGGVATPTPLRPLDARPSAGREPTTFAPVQPVRILRTFSSDPEVTPGHRTSGTALSPVSGQATVNAEVPKNYSVMPWKTAPLLRRHESTPVAADNKVPRPQLRTYSVPR